MFGMYDLRYKCIYKQDILAFGLNILQLPYIIIILFPCYYSCWLSSGSGTIWAFVGPVLFVIAVKCFDFALFISFVVHNMSILGTLYLI